MDRLRDPLTGVFSWRAFTSYATLTLSQAQRRGGSLALLLVSVDLPLSSSPGSGMALDAAPRVLAETLSQTVRGGDMAARQGRRAFAVLALDALESGAQRLAARIAGAMPRQITVMGRDASFTISVGIAVFPDGGATLPELIRHAESALTDASRSGGGQVRVYGAAPPPLPPQEVVSSSEPAVERFHLFVPQIELEARGLAPQPQTTPVGSRRASVSPRVALKELTAACERGEIEGIAIQTQPGACTVCLDAARDVYLPRFVPDLPLIGCWSLGGCRCAYRAPAPDPRRRPPPAPALSSDLPKVPGRLRDAAIFGESAKRSARPDEIAEYLDTFPLLSVDVDIELQQGESAYLAGRPARRAWERRSAGEAPIEGLPLPLEGPFRAWVRRAARPPTISELQLPHREEGTLYLTNWRLIFAHRRGVLDSNLLADITAVQLLRDGLAFNVGERSSRLVIFISDPLPVGLFIARAIRDVTSLAG